MFVDSHVNLHGDHYQDDLEDVILRAKAAGVNAMLTICDRMTSLPLITKLTEQQQNMWHSVGVHPHYAKEVPDLKAAEIIEAAAHNKAIGIGECGLDFHYEYSDAEDQEKVFREHIYAAQKTNLPLIIHTRNADDLMGRMLKEAAEEGAITPLMHCYTSGVDLANQALDMGGYISFSGIITFKKADDVRAVAEMVPLAQLLIETDCPYLAPVPYRGQRCEPAHVKEVCEKLAEIKGVSTEEMAQITTDNFYRLFGKAKRLESS